MSTTSLSVRDGYDRWAAIYDDEANPLVALEGPKVRALIGEAVGLTALDLGCGTGRHALWLASIGARVTAVDFSREMLAKARQKPCANQVRFIVHDLHDKALPFASETFDVVVSGLVLEHLRDLDPFFAEARRVLKPGARAVVSNMHPAMFLRGTRARFTDPQSGELVQPGSVIHSIGSIVLAAQRAGFELADIGEFNADAELAAQTPRAEKYIGWPMLVVVSLVAE
jgi:malonyl-CoA O-methyltransferase